MIKKNILFLIFGLLVGSSAWAQSYTVLDTGDTSERSCNPKVYIDLGNGIVRDEITGLEWERWGSSDTYNWQEAREYCGNLSLGDYADWRLPTVEELMTLVDAGRYDPAISPVFFASVDRYWTATNFAGNTLKAYFVDFASGRANNDAKKKNFNVRAVRSGTGGQADRITVQAASELDIYIPSVGQACSDDVDCGSGEECIADICVPSVGEPCSSDVDCESGEECIADICVPSVGEPCSSDVDCESGEECIADICVPLAGEPCLSDDDCDFGEECIADICVPSAGVSCLNDDDCYFGDECIDDICVPSVGPQPSFTVNGDGTVTENYTELIWAQCAYGQTLAGAECIDAALTHDFDSANAYIQNLNNTIYLGYDDWRLPTINELQSLMDRTRVMPSTTFPGMESGFYWASTNNAQDSHKAWDACFWFGNIHSDADKAENTQYTTRAVRSGSCLDLCVYDEDCAEGYVCTDGVCVADLCELSIQHKVIRSEKLSKPKNIVLKITGDEDFDVYGSLDLGLLDWVKSSYNTKKSKLKLKAIVPAGLEPGRIPVSVGNCSGEIHIQ